MGSYFLSFFPGKPGKSIKIVFNDGVNLARLRAALDWLGWETISNSLASLFGWRKF